MSFKWASHPALKKAVGIHRGNLLGEIRSYLALQPGWDGPGSLPLSGSSLIAANKFFQKAKLERDFSWSLTRRGTLQVTWDDATGFAIELEFCENRVDYYSELIDEDGSFYIGQYEEMLEHLPD